VTEPLQLQRHDREIGATGRLCKTGRRDISESHTILALFLHMAVTAKD
jgi:hypothetical protein